MNRAIALLPMLCLVLACRMPPPGTLLADDDPRPAALMATLHERADSRRALRATAKLDLTAPNVRLNRPQRMAVERPGRLRLEIIGLFSQIAAVLVTDGEVYQLYDARAGEVEEGLVSSALLWRVARVDLAPDEAVDLILGVPLPKRGLSPGTARVFDDGAIVVDQLTRSGRPGQRLHFDAYGRLSELETFVPDGDLLWRARFGDYRMLESPGSGAAGDVGRQEPFAFDVQLDFPRVDAEVRLRFKKVALAGSLSDDLFRLQLAGRSTSAPSLDSAGEER